MEKTDKKKYNTITQVTNLVIENCSDCKRSHLSSSNGRCTIFCDACMKFVHEGLKDVGCSDTIPDDCPLLEEDDRREGWNGRTTECDAMDCKDEANEETVFINAIGSHISMSKFKNNYYREGHAYKLNNRLYHYCYGYDDNGKPLVDSLFVMQDDVHKSTQVYHELAIPIPGLDFVNSVFKGEIVEVDANKFLSACKEVDCFVGRVKEIML